MRLAIVTPRYGDEILGGAESLARGLAERLATQGHDVHVWTSCARDYYTWESVYAAGTESVNGVTVHRFPITGWQPKKFAKYSQKLDTVGYLAWAKQLNWLQSGAHSSLLYEQLDSQVDDFAAIVTLPYQSTLVQAAAWIAPEKTVLIPCLHDEAYAYMETARLLLQTVCGVLFLTPEEQQLANNQLSVKVKQEAVLGAAVSLRNQSFSAPSPPTDPYLLTIGRLEKGKNLALLYDYIARLADEGHSIHLVLAGLGDFKPPAHPAFTWHKAVSETEKARLLAGAVALVHPSLNESFSLVLLESWLAGRPVLVHGNCAVTSGHVTRSQGGLTFVTYGDFVTAVHHLLNYPEKATAMGANGRAYVQQNYTWPVIIERLEGILARWLPTAK